MSARNVVRWFAAGALALAPAVTAPAQTHEATAGVTPEASAPVEQSAVTPARPPQVTCEHNQLFIAADDSTLSSVLAAVSTCLGIAMKPPTGFVDERTFAHLGPGPVNHVLDDLLGSTDLNYAMVLSGSADAKVTRVVLTSRAADAAQSKGEETGTTSTGAAMTTARKLWIASQNSSGRPATAEEGEPRPAESAPVGGAAAPLPAAADSVTTATNSVASAAEGALTAAPAKSASTTTTPTAAAEGKDNTAAAIASSAVPSAAAAVSSDAAVAAPPAARAATDAAKQEGSADDVLGHQINQMQQMFEQRRKLNNSTAPASDPQ